MRLRLQRLGCALVLFVGAGAGSIAGEPQSVTEAFVTNQTDDSLSIVRLADLKVAETLKIGGKPAGIAMSADGKQLYVTTGRSKVVLIVDTASNRVVGSIEVGPRPWGVALAPDGATLYTANGPSNDVSVVDIGTRQVTKKIPVGQGPWGIAVVKRPPAAR